MPVYKQTVGRISSRHSMKGRKSTMKKRIIFAVIASAMIAATAMTTLAYADDTTAAVSESTAVFTKGVWAAYADDDGDDKYDDLNTYYIFEDEKTGHTSSPDHGTGLPFSVEQKGKTALFHFASADDNTNAKIKALDGNDFMVTFTYESGDKKTYKFVFLVGADPDTFSGENDVYVDSGRPILKRGVYAAYGEDNAIVDYYIFEDETSGHTAKPANGLGLPFAIEPTGDGKAVIHFASADNNTPAEITAVKKGVYDVTLTGDNGVSATFRLVLLPDEDPDTFDAAEEGAAFITKGVYASYAFNEDSGEYDRLDDYYVFTGETEGHTSGPIMGMGVPFGVEQNGTEAVFHFASADDNTPAEINVLGDSDFLVTFTYNSGDTVTSRFIKLEAEDPDTFSGESAFYGDFEAVDGGLQLYDANYVFNRIDSVPADYRDTVLVVNYAMPLLEGFDLEFSFTTSDKQFKTYDVSYNGEINNDTIMFSVKDLLAAAGVNGENIAFFALTDKNDRAIVTAGFVGEFSNAVKVNITSSSVDSAKDDQNPATGVNDLFEVGTLAVIACATVIIFKKRK